jgi:hypothetical protein
MLIPDTKTKNPRYIQIRYTQTRKTLTNLMKLLPASIAVNFDYENVAPKALLRKHTVCKQALFVKLLRSLKLCQQGEAI